MIRIGTAVVIDNDEHGETITGRIVRETIDLDGPIFFTDDDTGQRVRMNGWQWCAEWQSDGSIFFYR